jgi:PAS domain S-box-containing protein
MENTTSPISSETNELEESDAFNRLVLESSPDCLKILDTEGRMQYMNFNGLCQLEIDDFGLFKNQLWWDLWGKENAHLVKDAVNTALKGEATQFSAFCPTVKGTPKWWHVTVTPVGSKTNGIYQILSVSRDITAQKNAEAEIIELNNLLEEKVRIRTAELLEKNIELEKTNNDLAVFNHIASHDLQEPLRKIQIYGNLLVDLGKDGNEMHAYLTRILDATGRMRKLISALHDFSISKNLKIDFADCDLNEVVGYSIDLFKDIISEKNAVISYEQLPVIQGSKVLITQVFTNLLGNALKYQKTGVAPSINITCKTEDSENLEIPTKNYKEFYVIRIEDNGIGFDTYYKDQIFEVFQRLHRKSEFSGTGIGLAICKTIVENHNGWIDATATLGIGSAFIVYFPKY